MKPIISIVGYSKSGKTTLLEKLIGEMVQRGYQVAVIKHSSDDLEFDSEPKDTWRFTRAGAEISAIGSSRKMAVFKDIDARFGPREFTEMIPDSYDILLTEGFKQSHFPKIEVHRNAPGTALVSPESELLAVVTDEPLAIDKPQLGLEQVAEIADVIEGEIIKHQNSSQGPPPGRHL